MSELNLTKENFETQISSGGVVLVDFYADWCGPCKMLAPIIEDLASEMEEKAKIFKFNVDESMEIAQKYGVQAIPTLIFFKDGEKVETLNGVQTKENLVNKINDLA